MGVRHGIVISGILMLIISCTATDNKEITIVADGQKITTASVNTSAPACPIDMLHVAGNFCTNAEQVCTSLDKSVHNANGYVKCDQYATTKCLTPETNRPHMNFCIDKYEYPNIEGGTPAVMVSWNEMRSNCAAQGKRLCRDVEWTFACEGEEAMPYPYGYDRESLTCNIDHRQKPNFDASKDEMTPETVSYLDQRVKSGSMASCVSPFGVHDMTGNVDEWTINSSGRPYNSSLKGGHWVIGARNRCRPATIIHNETFQYYEIGGRCCEDAK